MLWQQVKPAAHIPVVDPPHFLPRLMAPAGGGVGAGFGIVAKVLVGFRPSNAQTSPQMPGQSRAPRHGDKFETQQVWPV